jgi:hypothetical protein
VCVAEERRRVEQRIEAPSLTVALVPHNASVPSGAADTRGLAAAKSVICQFMCARSSGVRIR